MRMLGLRRLLVVLFLLILIIVVCSTGFYIIVLSNENSYLCRTNFVAKHICARLKLLKFETRFATARVLNDAMATVTTKASITISNNNNNKLKPIVKKLNIIKSQSIKSGMKLATPTNTEKNSNTPGSEWLDITEGRKFSNYGDGTCEDNPDREILHTLLARWLNVTAKHNITYFFTAGSLLGAWRNEDVIPYDTDLDVLIDSNDNAKLELIKDKRNFVESDNKFHLILQEDWGKPYTDRRRFKCNGKLVPHYSDHCSFQEPLGRIIKGNHHLDIYDYKLVNGSLSDPSEWPKSYKAADVFPLRKCRFMGLVGYCPKRPVAILHAFYGDDLLSSSVCKSGKWLKDRKKKA